MEGDLVMDQEQPIPDVPNAINMLGQIENALGQCNKMLEWLAANEDQEQLDKLSGYLLSSIMNIKTVRLGLYFRYMDQAPLQQNN